MVRRGQPHPAIKSVTFTPAPGNWVIKTYYNEGGDRWVTYWSINNDWNAKPSLARKFETKVEADDQLHAMQHKFDSPMRSRARVVPFDGEA